MTVVCAEHIVDIKLQSQAVFHETFVYRQVGVEHRLVYVMVLLISLCNISHHNGEHRPFRIEGVVESEHRHRLVQIASVSCLQLEPLLLDHCRQHRMPDAEGGLQVERRSHIIVRFAVYHSHQSDGGIVLIHLYCLINGVGYMFISQVESQPFVGKVVTCIS